MATAAQERRDTHTRRVCRVNQAKLALAAGTTKPLRAETAVEIAELLNTLIAVDARYFRLLELACRLHEAREKCNAVDLWRAISAVAQAATERVR